MSVAIKWAVMGGLFALIIAAALTYVGIIPVAAITGLFTSAWGAVGEPLAEACHCAHAILNYIVGVPQLVTFCIMFSLLGPVFRWGFDVVVNVCKFFSR